MPARYPLPALSYILQNTNGKFSDVTAEAGKEPQRIGLVITALWTDFDHDTQIDLLVAGEWMPVRFFKNVNGKFVAWNADEGKASQQSDQIYTPSDSHPITHSFGWWNSLAAGDFDNDGDIDYIAGNLGLNSKLPSGYISEAMAKVISSHSQLQKGAFMGAKMPRVWYTSLLMMDLP